MLVHLYTGSLGLVARSGVGQAVLHQKAMLIHIVVHISADVVTSLPNGHLFSLLGKMPGDYSTG